MLITRISGQVVGLACVIAVAGGCSTKYQPMGFMGGYDDFRIAADTFEISFRGNASTPPESVSRYTFRRASEVTLLHGYTHFLCVSEADRTRVDIVTNSSGKVSTIQKPRTAMRIRCYKAPLPDSEDLIDARGVLTFNFPDSLETRESSIVTEVE
ncbi:MAG: hypothetical protein IH987_14875 [Planctomycetes bacterium]|nr:hypothetical protein [Planctomycetota bacterium]